MIHLKFLIDHYREIQKHTKSLTSHLHRDGKQTQTYNGIRAEQQNAIPSTQKHFQLLLFLMASITLSTYIINVLLVALTPPIGIRLMMTEEFFGMSAPSSVYSEKHSVTYRTLTYHDISLQQTTFLSLSLIIHADKHL